MPMFMDVHEELPEGVGFADAAELHAADLKAQAAHGADFKRFWIDEEAGKVFCLIEAPNAEAAIAVHRDAHGMLADRIYEVREGS
ncbi:MAG: DUF4242 domain-containing protein [Actinomycetota bacterium]